MTKEEIINNIDSHIREKMLKDACHWLAYVETYLEALEDANVITNSEANYIYDEIINFEG